MTDLPTREALADTEARHAHRDLLAEKDAEIERLTALLGRASHLLSRAADACADGDLSDPRIDDLSAYASEIQTSIKEPRNDQ